MSNKQQQHKDDPRLSWAWDTAAAAGLLLIVAALWGVAWQLGVGVLGAAGIAVGVLGARAAAWRDAGGKTRRGDEEDG